MSIHTEKRRRFTRGGKGVFACQTCKRQTREVNGDHAQTGNCAWCYDLAGIENSISDNGAESIRCYYDEARDLLKKIEAAGGDMTWWADLTAILDGWKAEN